MSINTLFEQIWEKKVTFFVTFFIVFTLMYSVLFVLDFLPEPPAEDIVNDAVSEIQAIDATPTTVATASPVTISPTEATAETKIAPAGTSAVPDTGVAVFSPTKIFIPKLSKTVAVLNPESRTVADLDAALLDGVVRHPDSALLNQSGNVFILGHSSYLPNVLNKNFQAFNGIQNLEWGDTIEVQSSEKTFVYRVDKVYRAKASDLTVPIAGEKKKLTLATCNSFGTIDDRYIVEAYQIEVRTL